MSAPGHVRHQLRALLKLAIAAAGDRAGPIGARVHDVRAALKKARALLRLYGAMVGRRGRKERRRLRDVGRSIAPTRDAATVLETFDALASAGVRPTSSRAALRMRLAARRRRLEARARAERDLRRVMLALRLARRRATRRIPRRGAHRVVAEGFVRGYEKARVAMHEAYRRDLPEAFHAWRKAIKSHAFHVDLLTGAGVKILGRRSERLDALATALGQAHDLALLEETIQAERACFSDARDYQRLLDLVRRRQSQIYRAVRPRGRRLFAERPEAMRDIVTISSSAQTGVVSTPRR